MKYEQPESMCGVQVASRRTQCRFLFSPTFAEETGQLQVDCRSILKLETVEGADNLLRRFPFRLEESGTVPSQKSAGCGGHSEASGAPETNWTYYSAVPLMALLKLAIGRAFGDSSFFRYLLQCCLLIELLVTHEFPNAIGDGSCGWLRLRRSWADEERDFAF